MAGNALQIVAIELLAACQALDFRAPLRTSAPLLRAHAAMREHVPFAEQDRLLSEDIAMAARVVRGHAVQQPAGSLFPGGGA